VLFAAWAIFVVCCVCPIVWMLTSSTGSGAAATADVLHVARHRVLLSRTLLLGLGTTFCACCAGLPIGIALGRCDPARVALARFALIVPVVLPSYVLALAWMAVADTRFGAWTYSLSAAIVVLAFSFYPIVMLAAEAATRSVAGGLEEAGRLVASSWRVWARIVFPLIVPPVAAALLAVFVLAISDFAVPSMLRVRVYTTEVFTAFAALYDFRLATTMAMPLALVGAVVSLAALEMARKPSVGRTEHGQAGGRWTARRQLVTIAALCAIGISAVALPTGAIVFEARSGRASFVDAVSTDAIRNGLVWSASGATIVLVIGAVLGYWRARATHRTGRVIEMFWIMLFAIPATVTGIGIIGIWNRPGIIGDLYRTSAIVVIAFVSRFLPIAAVLCAAFLRRVPFAAEEAAVVSGASWSRTLARIVLPLSASGLAAVWLVMFILMLGDVALAVLVAPPGESNLAVRAYTLMANSPVPDVARIALVQIVLSVLPLAALVLVIRRLDAR
jgi:iron(III) transport system permease protein